MNFPLRRGVAVVLMDFMLQKARLPPCKSLKFCAFLGLLPSSLDSFIRECNSNLMHRGQMSKKVETPILPGKDGEKQLKGCILFQEITM